MNWILDRLKENSTWRGLILLAALGGAKLNPDQQEAIVTAGLALVALLNVFRKETKPGGDFNPEADVRKAQKP